jgi:hypothetical protein
VGRAPKQRRRIAASFDLIEQPGKRLYAEDILAAERAIAARILAT